MNTPQKLKTGFTTGSCTAACAKACALLISGQQLENIIPLEFPDGKIRDMKLNDWSKNNNEVSVSVIKDAGDDPDVTNKAKIYCTLRKLPFFEKTNKDYVLVFENLKLIIRGGSGVGLSTRIGLDVPVGKWAINPVPREMIANNIKNILSNSCYLFTVNVENGEKLAKKTLNFTLGIVGGISILGTSGIVYPNSHGAYIDTIKIHLRSANANFQKHIAFTTGARTAKAVMKDYPELTEKTCIRIGDYIAEALENAENYDFKQITIACMPGKLFKYACGHRYTHAHTVKLNPKEMLPIIEDLLSDEEKTHIMQSATVREALMVLPQDIYNETIIRWIKMAKMHFAKWTPSCKCNIKVY